MHVSIEWKMTKYPTFAIKLSSKEGAEPFLTVYDCRIVDGKNGQFVSFPARKDDQGRFWNYVRASDKFGAHILNLAEKERPEGDPIRTPPATSADEDIPF